MLRRRYRIRLCLEGLAIGILTGAVIAVFRILIDQADIYRPLWFQNFGAEKFSLTFCALILIGIFLARVIKFDGQIAGSGIPQIKAMLMGQAQMFKPIRLLALKFLSTILTICAGMSLGRAGISVQFGACIGDFFSNKSHIEDEILLTAGASAGLAAVFNAPLAGVIFCLEDLHKKFTPEILVATLTASVSASSVVKLVFGVRPIFETITAEPVAIPEILKVPTLEIFAEMSAEPLKIFLFFVALGIFLGIIGVIFNQAILTSLNVYDKFLGSRRFLIPLLLIIPIGLNLPRILGCGNVLVDELLRAQFDLKMTLILFAGKFLFTLICFGTGAPGGLFLPIMTLGALGGNIFAEIGMRLGFFSAEWATLSIIFGMTAMFAATVKAPVTGCLLMMEITGQFSYLLTLMIISGAAFMTADFLGGEPIFSALLNRTKK